MGRVNVAMCKVMLYGGVEGGLIYDIEIQGERMERVQEFKYPRCMVNDRGKDVVECVK